MKSNEPNSAQRGYASADLELQLQEDFDRRLRASELFGPPDWDDDLDGDDLDDDDLS